MADSKNKINRIKDLERQGYKVLKLNKMEAKEFDLLNIRYGRINGSRRCIVCALPLEYCLCDMIHVAGD
ncbi:MAG: hypothetical protein H3Z53_02920 [archaeon]|nr:hypothetical protein [archaeon]MCP8322438.1 hypothetical protein [archaeon]